MQRLVKKKSFQQLLSLQSKKVTTQANPRNYILPKFRHGDGYVRAAMYRRVDYKQKRGIRRNTRRELVLGERGNFI